MKAFIVATLKVDTQINKKFLELFEIKWSKTCLDLLKPNHEADIKKAEVARRKHWDIFVSLPLKNLSKL